jgi:putative membrane protein
MENGHSESVSNIHKRWSLTRINFSSYKISLLISLISSLIIIIFETYFYLNLDFVEIVGSIIIGISFLAASYFIDLFLLRKKTKINKISKVLHVSAFSNLLWMGLLIFGYLSFIIFHKENLPIEHLLEGAMLAMGLRIGIFTSVFGADLLKAISIAIIQPTIFLSLTIPYFMLYGVFSNTLAILFGLTIIGLGITWTIFADRAGRPNVQSTFAVLQAFLLAWTENRVEDIEKILLSKSKDELVTTEMIEFSMKDQNQLLVLPNIHPGPFKEIGGSNLPYQIYSYFTQNAVVFHSASDHSLNIPSKNEVRKYLETLSHTNNISEEGDTCTDPIQIKINNATATGIVFGNTVILMLSNSPYGMDDLPEKIGWELNRIAKDYGYKKVILIDSHNAMGRNNNKNKSEDILEAGKDCLKNLKQLPQYQFKFNISNTNEIEHNLQYGEDIGKSGLSVILFEIIYNGDEKQKSNKIKKNLKYAIGWADANNMENGLREYIINSLEQNGIKMLELCTSDTHENSGFRTSQGYFPFGQITKFETIANHYLKLIELANKKLKKSQYKISSTKSKVKVMGKNQFEDYSKALDKAMYLTKIFLIVTFGVTLVMLLK